MDLPSAGTTRKFFQMLEGKIFTAGLIIAVSWFSTIFALSIKFKAMSIGLLSMVASHLVIGRAGGITVGIEHELPQFLIVLNATIIDSLVVLIVYPTFVFTYRHYVKSKLFGEMIDISIDMAKRNQDKMARYGWIGLLFFVWFPLHMTGPLVGSILGFFMGLHALLNISVVIIGTFLAVISWVSFFGKIQDLTGKYSAFIPIGVVIIAAFVFFHVRRQHRKLRLKQEEHQRESQRLKALEKEGRG